MRISLKAMRTDKKLTQKAVGEAVGVSKKTVGAWESGKTVPDANKIDALCKLFGCSYDDIRWKA